ncbi:hypothetical protein T11_13696 [Trichinella zimbabwensis]|uniref:Uncharacterized protein n=1 Tax=Trichinella zimbabwensis TaxID=268475 RepID=A0A0V1GG31_9BILA|nr:hypothetical protein T11_13696 [Trichinella zimbabwensis]
MAEHSLHRLQKKLTVKSGAAVMSVTIKPVPLCQTMIL